MTGGQPRPERRRSDARFELVLDAGSQGTWSWDLQTGGWLLGDDGVVAAAASAAGVPAAPAAATPVALPDAGLEVGRA